MLLDRRVFFNCVPVCQPGSWCLLVCVITARDPDPNDRSKLNEHPTDNYVNCLQRFIEKYGFEMFLNKIPVSTLTDEALR